MGTPVQGPNGYSRNVMELYLSLGPNVPSMFRLCSSGSRLRFKFESLYSRRVWGVPNQETKMGLISCDTSVGVILCGLWQMPSL